jgi:hypothetical protein
MTSIPPIKKPDLERQPPFPEVVWVNPEDGARMFDEAARELLGISGQEFLRRWDSGEYAAVFDLPGYETVGDLASLMSLAR